MHWSQVRLSQVFKNFYEYWFLLNLGPCGWHHLHGNEKRDQHHQSFLANKYDRIHCLNHFLNIPQSIMDSFFFFLIWLILKALMPITFSSPGAQPEVVYFLVSNESPYFLIANLKFHLQTPCSFGDMAENVGVNWYTNK